MIFIYNNRNESFIFFIFSLFFFLIFYQYLLPHFFGWS